MDLQNSEETQSYLKQDPSSLIIDEEYHHKDFSSVQKLVKLPDQRKVSPYENVFPPVQNQLKNSDEISPELKQTMIDLREKLRNQFSTYQNSKNFKFSFPQSKFPAVEPGMRNMITYEQKNIVQDEDTFRDKLSPQQIQQISQNGQFKVRSNRQYITLPYVWKVNDTLFKGKQIIQLAWRKTIAKAHNIFYNAVNRFKSGVPVQISKMKKLPIRLFALFLGRKSMTVDYGVNYEHQIAKDFWDEVMQKHYTVSKQWGSDLWQYFDTSYKAQDFMTIRNLNQSQDQDDDSNKQHQRKLNQQTKSREKYEKRVNQRNTKKQLISSIGDEFQRSWTKNKKKIFAQISNQCTKETQQLNEVTQRQSQELIKQKQVKQKQSQQEILQKFNDKKFQCYTAYLQKKLPKIDIAQGVIQAIVTILTLMQIANKKQRKLLAKKSAERQRIQNQIRQQHKIKQYDSNWFSNQVEVRYKPIQKRLEEQYYNKYIDIEFIKKLNMKQKQVYNLWLEYRATYDARIQAKKRQIHQLYVPQRTFHSTYKLLPPYKVIKHKSNNYIWYEMVKQSKMQITTQTDFWKFKLYVMRVKSWTINCVVFLIYSCWKGPFGLRCLWGTSQFRCNQDINYHTGEIINQYRKPFLLVFLNVLSGIQKSRQQFEALPDRGLFGKNFSRIFNYIQCYVFRFAFVGVFLTLILYPIGIVVSSILTGLLIVTVWAWIPVILLVTYLFNVIFFQFQSSHVPYGFFIRAAPLLSLILSLIGNILAILILTLNLFVFSPIIAFFIALGAVISRGFRTITDGVMLFLISKLGRTPSRNTAIAKKISGPGMSKEYYMSINQEDVYILVQSQLEQIFMAQYNRIFTQKINQPTNRFNKVMQLLMNPLMSGSNYYNNQQNVVYQSVNELRNHYYTQYSNFMARYPIRPRNIRFTQQQIDSYFQNTVSIVNNFVQKKQIASWIFEQYHILEDCQQLTRKIWMIVFSCGQEIFEPLEKIDQRFKLEDMYKNDYDSYEEDSSYGTSGGGSFSNAKMKKNVHKVMEALEGEVQLKPRRANIQAFKHTLMNKQYRSSNLRQMFEFMDRNTGGRVSFSTTDPKHLFYANLAIKEIIKKDNFEYKWRKEENQKRK